MGIQHARRLGSLSAALAVGLFALWGSSMAAAQELHSFSVQDKDPASALRTLGAQAGIQILASAVDLSAVRLNPVTGTRRRSRRSAASWPVAVWITAM